MWDPYADFKKIILPNGLTLFASQVDREFEIFGFIIHAGAREDDFGENGTAHFVEHCMSQNVEGLTNEEIGLYFEKQGGFANLGTTDYLKTDYMYKCQVDAGHIRESLNIFGKMLLEARISKDIEQQRSIIIQEYYSKHPYESMREIWLHIQKCLFPGNKLAGFLRALGDIDVIKEITENDLQRFYDHYYTPANMSIVAIGKIPPQLIAEFLVKSPFGQLKPGQRTDVPAPCFPNYSAIARFDVKLSLLFGKDNPMMHGQYESCAVLPGTFDMEEIFFVRSLLGKTLFREIREKKGWAYEVDVFFENLQDLNKIKIAIPLETNSLPHIEELADLCIAKIPDDKELFNLMKALAINDPLLIDISCEKICRNSMNDITHSARIITNAEIIKKRKSITRDNVAEILSYLKPDKRLTTIFYP